MSHMLKRPWAVAGALGIAAATVAVVVLVTLVRKDSAHLPARPGSWAQVVPAPATVTPSDAAFTLADGASIVTTPDAAMPIGEYLAALLGHDTSVRSSTSPGAAERPRGGIGLALDPAAPEGAEAYQLDIAADGVSIRSRAAAGLFYGVQTLRQLMPGDLKGPITLPGGRAVDRPRFAYRGAMLDVARHFFGVAEVERLIGLSTMYKVNYLHLHLTDDQGWRMAVDSWPRLATEGGRTHVGGGNGGYYTKDDYRQIVAYAAARFVTVVPEVDLPGHTNAAQASYAELNCDGKATAPYTGINVGFSAPCAGDPDTNRFLTDVLGELAAITPGRYLHIGGDEATNMTPAAYASMVNRAQAVVAAKGKTVVGWHQIAGSTLTESAVLEFWDTSTSAPPAMNRAVAAGHPVILSPANHAYLDQKYDASTRIGLQWAGPTSVQASYDWNPSTLLTGIGERSILGVEGALWTETVTTMDDVEYLAFPRLAAIAEIAWSPASTHDWTAFRVRLGAQAARWNALGVHFARTGDVSWAAQ
jgi:hexosaminidase